MPERWMSDAACLDNDPSYWFPEPEWAVGVKGKAICEGCPVRKQCLEYGMDPALRFGIFGGLDPRQREKLRKARAK